jgi:hypothetical protein
MNVLQYITQVLVALLHVLTPRCLLRKFYDKGSFGQYVFQVHITCSVVWFDLLYIIVLCFLTVYCDTIVI